MTLLAAKHSETSVVASVRGADVSVAFEADPLGAIGVEISVIDFIVSDG